MGKSTVPLLKCGITCPLNNYMPISCIVHRNFSQSGCDEEKQYWGKVLNEMVVVLDIHQNYAALFIDLV